MTANASIASVAASSRQLMLNASHFTYLDSLPDDAIKIDYMKGVALNECYYIPSIDEFATRYIDKTNGNVKRIRILKPNKKGIITTRAIVGGIVAFSKNRYLELMRSAENPTVDGAIRNQNIQRIWQLQGELRRLLYDTHQLAIRIQNMIREYLVHPDVEIKEPADVYQK